MTPILAPVSLGCWHFLFKYLVSKIDFEAQDHLGLPIWDMAFMQSQLFQPGAPVLLTHLLLSLHCHYTDSHLFKLPQYQASSLKEMNRGAEWQKEMKATFNIFPW